MLKAKIAVAVVLGFAAVACAGGGEGDATPGGEQDIKAGAVAKEGEACGGSTLGAKTCAAGLACVGADPKVPGSHGKCEADTAKEGDVCGGAVLGAKPCAAGLSCVGADPHVPGSRGKCENPAAAELEGTWGSDGENMTNPVFTSSTSFTATGTHTGGSGVEFPPGQGPKPEPATYKGTLSGDTLKLEMTVNGDNTKMTFTKGKHTNVIHCL
jgi:hypothetical protein